MHFKANADLNAIGYTLLKYGASEAEIEFLLKGRQRVELNAMTSPQFIEFLERKFAEHGIRKVVPDADTLRLAALRAARIAKVQRAIDAMSEVSDAEAGADIPEDIEAQVRKELETRAERPLGRCAGRDHAATAEVTSRRGNEAGGVSESDTGSCAVPYWRLFFWSPTSLQR